MSRVARDRRVVSEGRTVESVSRSARWRGRHHQHSPCIPLLYAPGWGATTPGARHRFRRASRVARPSPGGAQRPTVWASRHQDLVRPEVVAPYRRAPGVSLRAKRCLLGATRQGQQGRPAWTLPHRRDGRRGRWMVVWYPCRRSSLGRPVHRPCMRQALRDVTMLVPATPGHPRTDVEAERKGRSLGERVCVRRCVC